MQRVRKQFSGTNPSNTSTTYTRIPSRGEGGQENNVPPFQAYEQGGGKRGRFRVRVSRLNVDDGEDEVRGWKER